MHDTHPELTKSDPCMRVSTGVTNFKSAFCIKYLNEMTFKLNSKIPIIEPKVKAKNKIFLFLSKVVDENGL